MMTEIRGEDHEPVEILHPLQEIAELLVGVAIMRVLDVGALTEERVGFVEKENPVAVAGQVKERGEVLFRVANILRNHGAEVHAVDVAPGGLAQERGGQRLAGAGGTVEERAVGQGLLRKWWSPLLNRSNHRKQCRKGADGDRELCVSRRRSW